LLVASERHIAMGETEQATALRVRADEIRRRLIEQ
jgi:hypothetical protein